MIETHTFLDKCNTIISNSHINYGLNPMVELYYGDLISRGLIHFDTNKVRSLVDNGTYPDRSKLRHILKMVNTASFSNENINKPFIDLPCTDIRERAVSFDLIFFLIPQDWDGGRGYDSDFDLHVVRAKSISRKPSNWFDSKCAETWMEGTGGIYTTDEFYLAVNGENETGTDTHIPAIIGRQHFDYGNEDIELDITDGGNTVMDGILPNYGIGIASQPELEYKHTRVSQYVGFFSKSTNGFYEPYVETRYEDTISDDRTNFYLDKDNRLYFYASAGGNAVNLDNLPTVKINDQEYTPKQATKGVYYIEVNMPSSEYESETMHYDIWSNLYYNGRKLPDAELYFTTKASEGYFSFGLPVETKPREKFVPSLHGIKMNENVTRGEVRKVNIDCRIEYTANQQYAVDGIDYRLYIKDGQREYDVIEWSPVEKVYNGNYFAIDTDSLLPANYFVDIRIKYDMEELIHREMLRFTIVDNITNIYGKK